MSRAALTLSILILHALLILAIALLLVFPLRLRLRLHLRIPSSHIRALLVSFPLLGPRNILNPPQIPILAPAAGPLDAPFEPRNGIMARLLERRPPRLRVRAVHGGAVARVGVCLLRVPCRAAL